MDKPRFYHFKFLWKLDFVSGTFHEQTLITHESEQMINKTQNDMVIAPNM